MHSGRRRKCILSTKNFATHFYYLRLQNADQHRPGLVLPPEFPYSILVLGSLVRLFGFFFRRFFCDVFTPRTGFLFLVVLVELSPEFGFLAKAGGDFVCPLRADKLAIHEKKTPTTTQN